ncbi:acyl carrier protein [Paenibacillus sp. PsM32]|uniref:acyl carrier protein n=1 Tax=Paenibacillus sp. PsM32 TaxID=3030536 RepID=UPI00263B2B37|nr:acyl carrier protein [Paenibacillus sp. PsM32]MDN4616890.1 acyl carrier protein [Paenibacillus sp. PsM32]
MEVSEQQVVPLLAQVLKMALGDLENLQPDDDLREYGLNSLSAVELIVELENHLNIMIDDDNLLLEELSTLRRIENILAQYV